MVLFFRRLIDPTRSDSKSLLEDVSPHQLVYFIAPADLPLLLGLIVLPWSRVTGLLHGKSVP